MSVRDISELGEDTRRVVEEYIAVLDSGFCQVTRDVAQDALDEVLSFALDSLEHDSGPEVARTVLAQLGEPDEYAIALCAAIRGESRSAEEPSDSAAPELAQPSARIFGMPANLQFPTPARLQSRMWNPHDPRIFTPKLVGIGWTINFAALAIRLGMIRPDDEDVPFESTPEPWLWAALAVPVSLTLGAVVAVSVMYSSLPPELPTHWGVRGTPDGFATKAGAILPLIAMMLAVTGYAMWASGRGKTRAHRAVAIAMASMFVVLLAFIVGVSVSYGKGIQAAAYWPWLMLAGALGLPLFELVVLSRLGRRAEVRSDLSATKGRESS